MTRPAIPPPGPITARIPTDNWRMCRHPSRISQDPSMAVVASRAFARPRVHDAGYYATAPAGGSRFASVSCPEFAESPATGRGLPGDVWALDVVMLYLRRRLPIPDKGTEWQICDVASRTSPDAYMGLSSMNKWLRKVEAERGGLGSSLMDGIIRQMTEPKRPARIKIRAVVQALGCGQNQD